jgi:hypothetical protein
MLGGEGRNRTGDTTVFSRVLYRLSYLAAAMQCTPLFPEPTLGAGDRLRRPGGPVRFCRATR